MSVNQEERRQFPRHEAHLEARLNFSVLLSDPVADERGVQQLRACAGHTLNLSKQGLAVVLHAQNIDEEYLRGRQGSMAIELDLPNGVSIAIQATPVRYEKRDEGYVIGARISGMSARDREFFDEYLKELAGK